METIENQDGSITEITEKTYLQITIKRDCDSPLSFIRLWKEPKATIATDLEKALKDVK